MFVSFICITAFLDKMTREVGVSLEVTGRNGNISRTAYSSSQEYCLITLPFLCCSLAMSFERSADFDLLHNYAVPCTSVTSSSFASSAAHASLRACFSSGEAKHMASGRRSFANARNLTIVSSELASSDAR